MTAKIMTLPQHFQISDPCGSLILVKFASESSSFSFVSTAVKHSGKTPLAVSAFQCSFQVRCNVYSQDTCRGDARACY